jgi:hypothetical protein
MAMHQNAVLAFLLTPSTHVALAPPCGLLTRTDLQYVDLASQPEDLTDISKEIKVVSHFMAYCSPYTMQ